MIKHLRYFLSPLLLSVAIFTVLKGNYYPIIFIICFDIFTMMGDLLLKEDDTDFKNASPFILNTALYINLPILYIFTSMMIFIFGDYSSPWYISSWAYAGVNILEVKSNQTFIDMIGLLFFAGLHIATMGTNPGHELIHRKRKKFDMFVGNWLLALSWDCTFAIEHVYGHHKNVGYADDPVTASRNESLFMFILRGTIKSHKDAWKIEIDHLRRRNNSPFTIKNKMIQGYIRSSFLCFIAYTIGGIVGLGFFIFWSILAKCFLETINFIEHYGLVRAKGEPVLPKHSWNSNHVMSSSLLYNLTRHSAHHEKANLRYWELRSYPDAPKLPYGYLSCLYLAFFAPPLFKKIMKPRLREWDEKYANENERKLVEKYS